MRYDTQELLDVTDGASQTAYKLYFPKLKLKIICFAPAEAA